MARLSIICFLLIIYGLKSEATISDKRLCADPKCSSVISHAKVILRYNSPDHRLVSLKPGETVYVYSKDAGNRSDLWGVEVNGRRGYAPKDFIREFQVYVPTKQLQHIVSTEEESSRALPAASFGVSAESVPENSSQQSISSPVEVIEGTTVYLNNDNVLGSQPIQATAVDPSVKATIAPQGKVVEPSQSVEEKGSEETTALPESEAEEEYVDDEGSGGEEEEEDEGEEEDIEDEDEGEDEENLQDSQNTENSAENVNQETFLNTTAEDIEEVVSIAKNDTEIVSNETATLEADNPPSSASANSEQPAKENITPTPPFFLQRQLPIPSNIVEQSIEESKTVEEVELATSEQVVDGTTTHAEHEEIVTDSPGKAGDVVGQPENTEKIEPSNIDNTEKITEPLNPIEEQVSEEPEPISEEGTVRANMEGQPIPEDILQANTAHTEQVYMQDISKESEASEIPPQSSTEQPTKEEAELEQTSEEITSESEETYRSETVILSTVESAFPSEVVVTGESESPVAADVPEASISDTQQINMEQVTTESNFDASNDDSLYVEDTVTESYRHPQEPATEIPTIIEVSEQVVVEKVLSSEGQQEPESGASEEDSPSSPDAEEKQAEFGATKEENPASLNSEEKQSESGATKEEGLGSPDSEEKQPEPDAPGEEGPSLSSRLVDTLFSLYGQLFNLVLGPSAVKEQVEEVHEESEAHHEADQLLNLAAGAMGDSVSEVASTIVEPVSQLFPQHASVVMQEAESVYGLTFLVVTAVTVLFFTLGYYFIQWKTHNGKFLAKISDLDNKLLASDRKASLLEEELRQARERAANAEDVGPTEEVVARLEEELRQVKAVRAELEEQVASLEKELDTATDAGLELNRMLSELLSAQNGSDSLAKSVEHLQKQLDSQRGALAEMNSTLSAKSLENESLQADLNVALESIKSLEAELGQVNETVAALQKEKDEIEHGYELKSSALEKQFTEALENKSTEAQRMSRELQTLQEVLDETRRTLASRDSELEVLREIIRKMDNEEGGGDLPKIKLEELVDIGRCKAELAVVTKERDDFKERLQGEEEARNLLQDHVQIVSEEVEHLRTKLTQAENAKVEAQLRLEVLSNYFKEKETQLQKEIGHQEALFVQKEGDVMSTSERIKSLQEEVENYKSQNESLKKEILDQERGLKAQIALLEKKAHENWVIARQTERRLEETKQENGQLRNSLTLAQRNRLNNTDAPKLNDHYPVETNGEHPTSPLPLPMGLQDLPGSPFHYGHPSSPPPPGQPPLTAPRPLPPFPFMPPPHAMHFLPPMIGDRRPPPLGRMSSPPPSPYDHSPPRSPPGRSFRSPPRYDHSPPRSPPRRSYRSPPRFDRSPPRSPPGRSYRSPPRFDRSPPPRYDHSPDRERYRHRPPSPRRSGRHSPFDRGQGPPRSGFRPLRRESPSESKGSGLSSGHSSESLDKSSRHSGRV